MRHSSLLHVIRHSGFDISVRHSGFVIRHLFYEQHPFAKMASHPPPHAARPGCHHRPAAVGLHDAAARRADHARQAAPQRVHLHSQRRERAHVADHEGRARLRIQHAAEIARETPREPHAHQRPASSQRHRAGARMPKGLAHRRQGQPGGRRVSQHSFRGSTHGRGYRATDAFRFARTFHFPRPHHARVVARRRAAARR